MAVLRRRRLTGQGRDGTVDRQRSARHGIGTRTAEPSARAIWRLAGLVPLLGLALAACGPGETVGDGTLVADEAVYPGAAGRLLGEVARTDGATAQLWETVGLSGDVPALDGQDLVVVTGGEAGNCPWDLADVTVERAAVTLRLGDQPGDDVCGGTWNPRALAVTVPTGVLDESAELRVVHPWGETEAVAPPQERPDPSRWERRTLATADVGTAGGCVDALVYATTADDTVSVTVRWDGAASRAAAEGGMAGEVTLPDPDVTVELQVGSDLSEERCTDVVAPGRPLVAGEWEAVSGRVRIGVEPQPHATGEMPDGTATVTLTDVELAPAGGAGGDAWRIDTLELRDASVGWTPG